MPAAGVRAYPRADEAGSRPAGSAGGPAGSACCLAVAGGVAFLGVHFSEHRAHGSRSPSRPGKPQLVPQEPEAGRRSPRPSSSRSGRSPTRFIESAVYRKHVDDSWALTTRELHQGLSRSDWASGEIPVVPYPANAVAEVRWQLDYSYADDVGLKVAFYPKPRLGRRRARSSRSRSRTTARRDRRTGSSPTGRRPAGAQLQNAQPGGPKAPVVGVGRGSARRGLAVRPGRD